MPEPERVLATVAYRGGHLERLRGRLRPRRAAPLARDDAAGIAAALQQADVAVLAGDLDERFLDPRGRPACAGSTATTPG